MPFDPDEYTSEQVTFNSKDGTPVTMFLVHRKDMKRNGKNPVYLYGYGGFNISRTPSFSAQNILLMEQGGIYALVNLRGGGDMANSGTGPGCWKRNRTFSMTLSPPPNTSSPRDIPRRKSWGLRRIERRSVGGGLYDAASGSVCGGSAGRRGDGHVALPPLYGRLGLGRGIWLQRKRSRFPLSVRLLSVA